MFRFCSVFLVFLFSFFIKTLGFISTYLYRSKQPRVAEENGSNFSANHSHEEDHLISKNSTVFWSSRFAGKEDLDLQKREKDCNENIADTVSGSISNSSKYEFMSGKDMCGYFEEQKTESFFVQEMFVGSSEVLDSCDQSVGCQNPKEEDSLEKSLDEDLDDLCSFRFKLFEFGCSEKLSDADCEDGILEEKDVSYEVELLPVDDFSTLESNQESVADGDDNVTISNVDDATDKMFHEECNPRNWMSSFLEESEQIELDFDHTKRAVDLDGEYIEVELEPQPSSLMHVVEEQFVIPSEEEELLDGSKDQKTCWDSDDDDEDNEQDVLSEHQNLVQQMKMELKNCKIRSLPTISEDNCETPPMVEHLKPLEIDPKIEYRDVIEEIQKFYKSYVEKMRKLDILNYQTLHAISFLQLKESDVFTAGGMKRAELVHFTLPRIRPCKGQRIYADPMHRSIVEMFRDLELVYVGQLCLSWEILCWLYVKAQELSGHDSQGNHSYNRAAEEFQQFQVLVQRFIEDEPFQGQRIQNYVNNRCMIKSLLQVPTIKDDCLNTKKEQKEETDAVSLETLIDTIKESMMVFREFLFADKESTNVSLNSIQETGLTNIVVTTLHKKARKIKEHVRSKNCIVKKLKKHQECRIDHDVMTSDVDLRLVARVLSLSRLTTDQLVWCQNKLMNISFVGRKVHVEQCFLLFPC